MATMNAVQILGLSFLCGGALVFVCGMLYIKNRYSCPSMRQNKVKAQ